jgi:hypothetical protein
MLPILAAKNDGIIIELGRTTDAYVELGEDAVGSRHMIDGPSVNDPPRYVHALALLPDLGKNLLLDEMYNFV